MDVPVDDRAYLDIKQVTFDRRLSEASSTYLIRAITGEIRPNRDRPLIQVARTIFALGAAIAGDTRRVQDRVIEILLDRNKASPSHLAQRIGALAGTSPAVNIGPEGIDLSPLDIQWETSWGAIAQHVALADFMLTADDLDGFAALSGQFRRLVAERERGEAVITDVTRELGRHMYAWRKAHMPLAAVEKEARAILQFLSGRGERKVSITATTDQDVIAFWLSAIEDPERDRQTERPLFRTTLERFRDVEEVARAAEDMRGMANAADIQDPALIGEKALGVSWAEGTGGTGFAVANDDGLAHPALGAIGRIPRSPNVLTQRERERIARVLSLAPYHVTKPLSLLRDFAFGDLQAKLVNDTRRGLDAEQLTRRFGSNDVTTYVDVHGTYGELHGHLVKLLRIAMVLRGAANTREVAVGEGEAFEVPDDLRAKGMKDLRSMRREGFDAAEEALIDAFAGMDLDLLAVEQGLKPFVAAVEALHRTEALDERFARDRIIFERAFAALYLG